MNAYDLARTITGYVNEGQHDDLFIARWIEGFQDIAALKRELVCALLVHDKMVMFMLDDVIQHYHLLDGINLRIAVPAERARQAQRG